MRVLQKALGATAGHARFHVSRGTIGSSFFEGADTSSVRSVQVTTLDDELDLQPGRSLLVKLNVEGAEPFVLDGMARTLERAGKVTSSSRFIRLCSSRQASSPPR